MKITISKLRKIIKEVVSSSDEEVAHAEYEEMKSYQKSASIASIFDNAIDAETIQSLKETEPTVSKFMDAVMKLHSKSIKDGLAKSTQFRGHQSLQDFFNSEKDAFEIIDETDKYWALSKKFANKKINTQSDNVYGNTVSGVFHVPTGVRVDVKKQYNRGGLGT
jgi:hypothetical protein